MDIVHRSHAKYIRFLYGRKLQSNTRRCRMDVQKIVKKYLHENGFGGLMEPWGECACEIDDLMPCCDPCADCEPGYKHVTDMSKGWDFRISKTKP